MIQGTIHIRQGRTEWKGANQIHADLVSGLGQKLYQVLDISLKNYFHVFTEQITSLEDADGILLRDTEDRFYTAPTTEVESGSLRRKRWQSVINPPSAFTLNGMQLGRELLSPMASSFPHMFQLNYAFRVFAQPFEIQANVPVLIVWDIQID